MKRVIDYSRFSDDELQDERSIPDQQRICEDFAEPIAPGCGPIRHFEDAGISGASMITRPGLQALLQAVTAGEVDIVICEALGRLSRNQADIARIYQLLDYAGVQLFTVEEGKIDEMVIGFKGTMNALFLKSLAAKTRRGLLGQVERGFMAGGLSYPYRVVSRGVWEIVPEHGEVALRIVQEFAANLSPVTITTRLNREGIPGPDGGLWSPTTLHGWSSRATGLLNNELLIGIYVWPKQRYRKDPRTGKRIGRPVPDSERGRYPRPHLRLAGLTDELWAAVKARQAATRRAMRVARVYGRRPKFVFSGLTKCGSCEGTFGVAGRDELRCYNHVKRGMCANTRMIKRQEVEARALRALKERFLADPVAFAGFCAGFQEAQNQERMELRGRIIATKREVDRVTRGIRKIIDAIVAGVPGEELKTKMEDMQARKTALVAQMATLEQPEPLLHPSMADVYRKKVEQLAEALEHEDEAQRSAAREGLRDFVTAIIIPQGNELLTVKGDLGRMLAAVASGVGRSTLATAAQSGCGGGI